MPINYETYLPLIEDMGLGREDSVGLIDALHAIVESFVDRAFGEDAVQQACGQRQGKDGAAGIEAPCSEITITYNDVAARKPRGRPA